MVRKDGHEKDGDGTMILAVLEMERESTLEDVDMVLLKFQKKQWKGIFRNGEEINS